MYYTTGNKLKLYCSNIFKCLALNITYQCFSKGDNMPVKQLQCLIGTKLPPLKMHYVKSKASASGLISFMLTWSSLCLSRKNKGRIFLAPKRYCNSIYSHEQLILSFHLDLLWRTAVLSTVRHKCLNVPVLLSFLRKTISVYLPPTHQQLNFDYADFCTGIE